MPAPNFSLAVEDPVDWHIPDYLYQQYVVSSLERYLEEKGEQKRGKLIWGLNAITVAIEEDDDDIGYVILFKGNTCNTTIRHIPIACHIKGIKFLSVTRRVAVSENWPMRELCALLVRKQNTVLYDLQKPTWLCCNICKLNSA